jgi:hypothetical protein
MAGELPGHFHSWPSLADDAGQRMADLLIDQGHDSLGVMLSLSAFADGLSTLLGEMDAPDAEGLTKRAVETARETIQRRKVN